MGWKLMTPCTPAAASASMQACTPARVQPESHSTSSMPAVAAASRMPALMA